MALPQASLASKDGLCFLSFKFVGRQTMISTMNEKPPPFELIYSRDTPRQIYSQFL